VKAPQTRLGVKTLLMTLMMTQLMASGLELLYAVLTLQIKLIDTNLLTASS
jgi:hypothetical protein